MSLTGIFLLALFLPVSSSDLDLKEFKQLHSEPRPAKQKWNEIDWYSDLVTAQHVAVKQKKPLFIWAMDGHPLGCT